jgi:hypothetical protein
MEPEEEAEKLVEELGCYAQQADAVGSVLVDLLESKRKHQGLIAEASDTYQLLTLDIVEIYNAFKRVCKKAGRFR